MTIYHLNLTPIHRTRGHSATAASAYQAGECLQDARTGETHDFRKKRGVVTTGIALPDGAPVWASDRSALWGAAELAEKRKDGRPGRRMTIALPAELTRKQQHTLLSRFAQALAERYRTAIDWALHQPDARLGSTGDVPGGDLRNWHGHLMLPARVLTPTGFGPKIRILDDRASGPVEIDAIRALWQDHANTALAAAGRDERVDARSLAAQGADRPPTAHLGRATIECERRGIVTERGAQWRTTRHLVSAVATAEADWQEARRAYDKAWGEAIVENHRREMVERATFRLAEISAQPQPKPPHRSRCCVLPVPTSPTSSTLEALKTLLRRRLEAWRQRRRIPPEVREFYRLCQRAAHAAKWYSTERSPSRKQLTWSLLRARDALRRRHGDQWRVPLTEAGHLLRVRPGARHVADGLLRLPRPPAIDPARSSNRGLPYSPPSKKAAQRPCRSSRRRPAPEREL
jgi:hypothetical protein